MSSKAQSTPQRVHGAATTAVVTEPVAAALPPRKVAELVRQLAESQYEAQQLHQRMELLQRENASLHAAILRRHDAVSIESVAPSQQKLSPNFKQQQQLRRGEGEESPAGVERDTTATHRTSVKTPAFIDRVMSVVPKAQAPFALEATGALLTPPCSFLKADDEPPAVGTQRSSHVDSCWKRKYAKLKRVHEKTLRERDEQLAEVQQLVYQIHAEHDELRHRHERERLQQQLGLESKNRMLLEAKADSLEKETLAWRQRFLRLLEGSTQLRNPVMAPEVTPSLSDACDRENPPSRPDGLNQTDRSFVWTESALASVLNTHTSPQIAGDLPGCCNGDTVRKKMNDVEQLYRQLQQQRGEDVVNSVGSLGIQNASLRSFTAICRRSIAVQVRPSTTTATSQTETRGRRSVGTFVDVGNQNNEVVKDMLHSAGEPELTQHGAQKKISTISDRNIAELPQSHFSETLKSSHPVCALQPAQQKSLQHHVYYSLNQAHGMGNNRQPSSSPLVGLAKERKLFLTNFAFPVASSSACMTSFGTVPDGDQAERDRLEADIRRHDQLLESVAKLQRQAQRVAKTPSF
ncbi:hypothetical protein TraAM80_08007 [Trypanosoma rangeli]|uniref:Uncharacterized protein n=1 Tax=Trypanosoma rangeli TaxID=5698 RepID=A0A422N2R7_TRYRA|nr:uncharacterized protein TraAM80_08007 [Trypanosoma rangeli]RNE99743.1 hypothetical protein TraAM80_08007 [Trypanosoma rangeli]|eukprot:RNE99743.1 hypothetical protein TraAM80_08007 [Trypanosoma rangeli]